MIGFEGIEDPSFQLRSQMESETPSIRMSNELGKKLGLSSFDLTAIANGLLPNYPARRDPVRVYLDLNHWISLSKALKGRADGKKYESPLRFLQDASNSGAVVVPLSATHYMEVTKIASVDQRSDLANVMSMVSHFVTLASPKDRLDFEVASALSLRFPQMPAQLTFSDLGVGFRFAFGQGIEPNGSATALDDSVKKTDLLDLEHYANQLMEYMILRGPRPSDTSQIHDYDQYAADRIAEERAQSEQKILEIIKATDNPNISLEDAAYARMLWDYVIPRLPLLLDQAGVAKESFDALGKQWYKELLDDVPLISVQLALIIQANKNGSRTWTRNDINDMDALGLAVPTCDIVVTEKYACDILNRSGIARRFRTVVIRSLDDLVKELELRLD